MNTAAAPRCVRCGSLLRHVPLDVRPPRAGPFSRLGTWAQQHLRFRPSGEASVRRCMAGLVPGLGHALEGVPLGAAAVALAQAALLGQAVWFAGTTWGRIVIALMIFNHGFSMVDLGRKTLAAMPVRRRLMAGALLTLLPAMLFYLPAQALWSPGRGPQGAAVRRPDEIAARGVRPGDIIVHGGA